MECHWHVGYKKGSDLDTLKVLKCLCLKQVIKIIMNDSVRYQNE